MPLNGTPQEEPPGYAIELLVAVFTDTDTLTYTLEPWEASIEATTKGKCQAVIGAAKDEAPSLTFPTEPIARVQYGLWADKDSKFIYSAENLKNVKIGVIKGYTYWPDIDKLVQDKAPNIKVFDGDYALADVVTALANGEIDLYPEAKPVFAWALVDQKLDKADFVSKHEEDGGFIYVAFAPDKRGAELAAKWDAGVARLRADGTLAKILAKYNVADWK
jgi:polar amino acid transport system substrate-binding protein